MEHEMVGSFLSLVFVLIGMAIYGVPVALVLRKAGYSAWWVILGFVPFVNIVMLWVFALSKWPIENR